MTCEDSPTADDDELPMLTLNAREIADSAAAEVISAADDFALEMISSILSLSASLLLASSIALLIALVTEADAAETGAESMRTGPREV